MEQTPRDASVAKVEHASLGEADFQALAESVRLAFLSWADATSGVQDSYRTVGLLAQPGKEQSRRIVRSVHLPVGTRLFKLSKYQEKWERDTLSPWWSTVHRFHENRDGVQELLRVAQDNGVTLRELIRFASAVPVDWNTLDHYLEIELVRGVDAFWGQFAPQKGVHSTAPTDAPVARQGNDARITYGVDDTVYLPDTLGGLGAWQLYIPDFSKHFIDRASIVNLEAIDNDALEHYFDSHP